MKTLMVGAPTGVAHRALSRQTAAPRFGMVHDLTPDKAEAFKAFLRDLQAQKPKPADEFRAERQFLGKLTEEPMGDSYVIYPDVPEKGHMLVGVSHPVVDRLRALIPGKNWDDEDLDVLKRLESQGQGLDAFLAQAKNQGQFHVVA